MIEIELTLDEIALAMQVGVRRQLESLRRGLVDRHGADGSSVASGLQRHIEGAGGELAFAKAMGRFWAGDTNAGKRTDVGRAQVRTRSNHAWDLIIRADDADDEFFVLVTGVLPCYRIVGYIRAADGKREEFAQDHGGHGRAWFVPQHALSGISG